MSRTKKIAVLAIIAMVLTLMPAAMFAATADSTRLAGTDRIGTSLEIAGAGWTTASTVILVPADQANLVDALAAAPLAGQENAPILLTGKTALDASVKAKIAALGATKVYVIGAISDAVVAEVNAISGVTATKLAGADRWATANAINAKLTSPAGTFVVGYNSLADALSVASYAAAKDFAIVLTKADGTVDSSKIVGSTTYLVGGTTVVKDYAGATRLSGADRFATNTAVVSTLGFNLGKVYIANGLSLVDALAASSLAGKYTAPILLSNGSSVPAASVVKDKVETVIALGGTNAVSDAVKNSVTAAPIKEITSVAGVDGKVYYSTNAGQFLAFTVNGGRTISLNALENLGYDIEFTATDNVFFGTDVSLTGELFKDDLDGLLVDSFFDFDYTIVVKKDGLIVAESDPVTVRVIDGDYAAASAITSYKLAKVDDADATTTLIDKLSSNTLVKGEYAAVTEVKADTVNGSKNVDILEDVVLSSSNPYVVSISDTTPTVMRAEMPGSATITIESGSVTKTFTINVVGASGVRKASKVTASSSSLKVATTGTAFLQLTVLDQYGDPFVGDEDDAYSYAIDANVYNADSEIIADCAGGDPDTKGKINIAVVDNAAATTGSGSLFIKKVNADGLVGSSVLSLPVAVSAQSAVAKYVIEAANGDSADYTIDLNPEAAAKDKNVNVGLYIMGYTSGGYAVAPAEAAEIAGITEVCPSSFPGMITADAAPALGGLVTVTGSLIPGFTGTSQVKVTTTSGIAVANRTITVKNTAPAITDVTFESVGTVTDTSLPISEVLQVKNIATNGSAGYGKIKIDDATGYIFYDVNVAGDGEDDT